MLNRCCHFYKITFCHHCDSETHSQEHIFHTIVDVFVVVRLLWPDTMLLQKNK